VVPELRRTAVRELVLVREPLVVPELEAVLDGGLEDGLRDTVPEGLSPDPDPDRVAAARCPKAGRPARTRPQVMVASIRGRFATLMTAPPSIVPGLPMLAAAP
jgi:hypothetical protein